jgi:hypothetical protein
MSKLSLAFLIGLVLGLISYGTYHNGLNAMWSEKIVKGAGHTLVPVDGEVIEADFIEISGRCRTARKLFL